jgi:hypothetical protein
VGQRQLKQRDGGVNLFAVTAPKEMKQLEWEATGTSSVTGRGGEGKHTGWR